MYCTRPPSPRTLRDEPSRTARAPRGPYRGGLVRPGAGEVRGGARHQYGGRTGRVNREPRPEVLTVRDGHDGRAVEQLLRHPRRRRSSHRRRSSGRRPGRGASERHARAHGLDRLPSHAKVYRSSPWVTSAAPQPGSPSPKRRIGVLRARIDDRPLRRLVEALPDRERLAHATEVEVARLRIDEAIRDQARSRAASNTGAPGHTAQRAPHGASAQSSPA